MAPGRSPKLIEQLQAQRVISLAMDGMQLIELLQLHEFTSAQRKIVKKAAQDLIVQLS